MPEFEGFSVKRFRSPVRPHVVLIMIVPATGAWSRPKAQWRRQAVQELRWQRTAKPEQCVKPAGIGTRRCTAGDGHCCDRRRQSGQRLAPSAYRPHAPTQPA